jgi:hypothetical protein
LSVPQDPALPQLGLLLDAAATTPLLARSLGREAEVEAVEVARVRYTPGARVIVHYRARVDGAPHDAVAAAAADRDLAKLVGKERHRTLARAVNGRSPAVDPFTYDRDADATISWLPFDAGLPALALPSDVLLPKLRALGVPVAASAGEPVRTGYKPGERAVLRLADHVLKAYGSERRFRAAAASLAAGAAAPSVPTTRVAAALVEVRLTVQEALPGVVPASAAGAAGAAGELLRRLQGARLRRLEPNPPEAIWGAALRRAELARAVVPDVAHRLDALLARLALTVPPRGPLVPAHGDFNADQLLAAGKELHVVDLDELCAAPPAYDLAAYAADVVRGRPDDEAALAAVLPPLLDGYGGRPPDLGWQLATAILARAPHPFLKLLPGWEERVAGTVAAAELALELDR